MSLANKMRYSPDLTVKGSVWFLLSFIFFSCCIFMAGIKHLGSGGNVWIIMFAPSSPCFLPWWPRGSLYNSLHIPYISSWWLLSETRKNSCFATFICFSNYIKREEAAQCRVQRIGPWSWRDLVLKPRSQCGCWIKLLNLSAKVYPCREDEECHLVALVRLRATVGQHLA